MQNVHVMMGRGGGAREGEGCSAAEHIPPGLIEIQRHIMLRTVRGIASFATLPLHV